VEGVWIVGIWLFSCSGRMGGIGRGWGWESDIFLDIFCSSGKGRTCVWFYLLSSTSSNRYEDGTSPTRSNPTGNRHLTYHTSVCPVRVIGVLDGLLRIPFSRHSVVVTPLRRLGNPVHLSHFHSTRGNM